MANSPSITRRAAVIGALVSSVALAVPAAAAVTRTRPETTFLKVRRLQRELAEAMGQLTAEGGPDYVAITTAEDCRIVLRESRLDMAISEARAAMRDQGAERFFIYFREAEQAHLGGGTEFNPDGSARRIFTLGGV